MPGIPLCPNPACRAENEPGSKFCIACGAALDEPGPPPTPPTSPGAGRQVTAISASEGSVVASGPGARAVNNSGTYIESLTIKPPPLRSCPGCGQQVSPEAHFCRYCGKPLQEA